MHIHLACVSCFVLMMTATMMPTTNHTMAITATMTPPTIGPTSVPATVGGVGATEQKSG